MSVSTMWVGGGCSSHQPLLAKMPCSGAPVLWWLGMALGTSGPPSVRVWVLARGHPGSRSWHHAHSHARLPLPPGGRCGDLPLREASGGRQGRGRRGPACTSLSQREPWGPDGGGPPAGLAAGLRSGMAGETAAPPPGAGRPPSPRRCRSAGRRRGDRGPCGCGPDISREPWQGEGRSEASGSRPWE